MRIHIRMVSAAHDKTIYTVKVLMVQGGGGSHSIYLSPVILVTCTI